MATVSIPIHRAGRVLVLAACAALALGCASSRGPDAEGAEDGGPGDAGRPDGGRDGGVDAGPERCVTDADCMDDRFCTGDRFCDLDTGLCRDGRPPDCGRLLCFGAVCDAAADACVAPDADEDGDVLLGCPGGTDCDDRDREVSGDAVERCADGKDNDCNGLRDCVDPACAGDRACDHCETTSVETHCDDGLDDDCDGFFDAEDSDCCVPFDAGEVCSNGTDGDCDGLELCDDPDCADEPDCL